MKKLLVTVIGAAAAIGAFADGYTNAQRFEDLARGETSIGNLNAAAGATYWSENADDTKTNEYTIVEMDGENYTGNEPAAFTSTPTNALSVKTQFGKPLEFAVGSGAREIGSGLYFDSLVKFTVCDDAPTQEYSDAKIVMWLQGDDDTPTKLMVKAGKLSVGQGGVEVVSAIYTNGNSIAADFADKWHRVTIKAISNITTDPTVVVPAFAIYIDEEPYAASDAKWDSTFTYGLTPTAAELNVTGALFPSLKQDSNEESNGKLACAGFDGTGSLNDLVFTDVAPSFAEDTVPDVVTVDIGGTQTPYPSLAAAIDAIGSVSGNVTFTLLGDVTLDAPVEFTGAANITLDFAGCVITNTIADAIITNSAALTITDSVGNGGIYCTAQDASALSQTGDGSLAISGGNFWGIIDLENATTVEISGGSFKEDDTGAYARYIVPGKTVEENSETGLFDVVDAVAKNGTAYYATFKAAVEAASAGDTVEILANCTESSYVWFENGITVSNNYTVALSGIYALRFINGTSSPVTIAGTGTIAGSGTGSPILIGVNETKTQNAKEGTKTSENGFDGTLYAGSLVLDGNTVTYSGSGNVIKVESGVFTMESGTVTAGGNRGVKADADAGSFTSTVVINGGTITSTKAAVAASADTGTANATINGGSITGPLTCAQDAGTATLTIPGTSTAKFDRDQSSFCATGYETTLSDGWYVVTKIPVYYTDISLNTNALEMVTNTTETLVATTTPASTADDSLTWTTSDATVATVENGVVTAVAAGEATITVTATHDSSVTASCTVTVTAPSVGPAPIAPGGESSASYESQAAAEAAAASVTIAVPDAVAEVITDSTAQEAYKALFEAKVVPAGEGQYKVVVDLKSAIEEQIQTAVDTANTTTLGAVLAAETDTANVSVTTKPGLYYQIVTGNSLPLPAPAANKWVMAEGDSSTIQVTKPEGDAAFFKVYCSPTK